MSKKVLVVYGSDAGSTAEVADFIGKTLIENGLQADVKPAGSADNAEGYDAAVIGTNIRAGKTNKSLKNFTARNLGSLEKIPTAFFAVCLTMKEDTPDNRKFVSSRMEVLEAGLKPVDEGLFAGKVNLAKLKPFPRFIMKNMVKAVDHDYRDWNAIRIWAENLGIKLNS
jgi:menaquinone-dependent protoporphyrinogen oxidase